MKSINTLCLCVFSTVDDEDELLYGESDTSVFTSSFDVGNKDSSKDK